MNNAFKDKLRQLRERTPVGMRHGLVLLERCQGDVERAEKEFQDETLEVVVAETGVEREIARQYLSVSGYDIHRALKSLDEERYTLTQRILRNHQDKEAALDVLTSALLESHSLRSLGDTWMDRELLQSLPFPVSDLLAAVEWLHYEAYEGFQYTLSFHLGDLIHRLHRLELSELAGSLQRAKAIASAVSKQHDEMNGINKIVAVSRELHENAELRRCEEEFEKTRERLIERLYEVVEQNIALFP